MAGPAHSVTADGQRVVAGRYVLLEQLGSGGMGTVWRAHDDVLGRQVALKEVVYPHGLPEGDRSVLRERTRREARAAARLHHDSAVTVYDVVEDDGSPFIVMELVDGRTLAEVLRDEGPLPPQRVARIGLAVLGALEAAHRQGILHRDVKPGNVLLCGEHPGDGRGRVVLTDFGIATSAGDSTLTSNGLLLGSPAYIAPERARGQRPGPASDLWSLGATLFTAAVGHAPYQRDEPVATLTAVASGEPVELAPSGPLEPVLRGLLERDPDRRLDAAATRRMLQQIARSSTQGAAAPTRPLDDASHRTAVLPIAAVDTGAEEPAVPSAQRRPPSDRAAVSAPAVQPVEVSRPRPAPVRRPEPRRSRAVPVLPLALAGVLLVAAVAGGVALTHRGNGTGQSAASATTPPTTPPSTAPTTPSTGAGTGSPAAPSTKPSSVPSTASTTAAGSAAPPPAGWVAHRGGPGWTAYVPATWQVSTFSGNPQYRDPSTGRTLRVSTTGAGGGKSDAVQDRRDQAAAFERSHPDYREIGISSVDYRGFEAADWEFTYSGLHVLNRVFVVDGRGYSLFFQTPQSDDWSAARAQLDAVAASFVPA